MKPPARDEYSEFYADYIGAVPPTDMSSFLADQLDEVRSLLGELSADQVDFRYAEGKWSVKEMLGHMVDAERVFSYRAMCIARGDDQPLPGMDQDAYAAGADFGTRTFESLLTEFEHLRRANIELFGSLSEETGDRRGTASGNPFTVRALVYIVAGHVQHHIRELKKRYLLH